MIEAGAASVTYVCDATMQKPIKAKYEGKRRSITDIKTRERMDKRRAREQELRTIISERRDAELLAVQLDSERPGTPSVSAVPVFSDRSMPLPPSASASPPLLTTGKRAGMHTDATVSSRSPPAKRPAIGSNTVDVDKDDDSPKGDSALATEFLELELSNVTEALLNHALESKVVADDGTQAGFRSIIIDAATTFSDYTRTLCDGETPDVCVIVANSEEAELLCAALAVEREHKDASAGLASENKYIVVTRDFDAVVAMPQQVMLENHTEIWLRDGLLDIFGNKSSILHAAASIAGCDEAPKAKGVMLTRALKMAEKHDGDIVTLLEKEKIVYPETDDVESGNSDVVEAFGLFQRIHNGIIPPDSYVTIE
jgi:hypothetical protein